MTQIETLHQVYCQHTGLEVQCTMFRLLSWEAFIKRGFTADDLRVVCKSLRREVDRGKRGYGSLSFHLLVGDLEYFEERLAEIRALQRKSKFSWGKADVLRATGREGEPKQAEAKPAKDVVEGLKIAEKLRNFKNEL